MNDELPPHSLECEAGILSCLLQSPVEVFGEIGNKIRADSFYDLKHKILFSTLRQKFDAQEVIDLTTVVSTLKDDGQLEKLGGIAWLSEIQDCAPSVSHVSEYVREVTDKQIRRRIIQKSHQLAKWAGNGHSLDEITNFGRSLFDIDSLKEIPVLDARQSGVALMDDLERRFRLNGELSGLDTGFPGLNEMTEGLQFGEQTIIGARPSMGKTAIGINIFQHAVFKRGVPSLFVSIEMSVAALMRRIMSSFCSIPVKEIRRGSYTQENFEKFAEFQRVLQKAPIHILDAVGGISISDLRHRVRSYVKKHGIRLVGIDYLQKIYPSSKHEKRTYEIGEISGQLKSLAVETGAAFLTLAQLNRESEKDKGRRPRISDLADSGQIERDADTIALIHRDRADESGATELIIGKQRDGETGVVNLRFNGVFCRFESQF